MGWLAQKAVARNLNHAGGERMKKTAFARIVVLIVVAAVIVAALTGCAPKSATLDAIKKAGVLKWGSDPTFEPFEFIDKNNNPTGFDVDLVAAIAAKLGVKTSLTSGAFDGLLMALDTNKFDLVCAAMTITPLREKQVAFSIPYYRADMGIMYNLSLIHI